MEHKAQDKQDQFKSRDQKNPSRSDNSQQKRQESGNAKRPGYEEKKR